MQWHIPVLLTRKRSESHFTLELFSFLKLRPLILVLCKDLALTVLNDAVLQVKEAFDFLRSLAIEAR